MKDFLIKLLAQLVKRLPDNYNTLKKINFFAPSILLSHVRPTFSNLPLNIFPVKTDVSILESQYDKIILFNWGKHFGEAGIPRDVDSVELRTEALKLKNALGQSAFEDIAKVALQTLSMPVSNAIAERTFSFMNGIKTKARNRLKIETMDSLLRIRIDSKVKNICCKGFTPLKSILLKYNHTIYTETSKPNGQEPKDEFSVLLEL